ncbi:MAG: putative Ig domain-containing protein [Spirosomataceae bacterium]
MKQAVFFWVRIIAVWLLLGHIPATLAQDNQRYVGLQLLNLDPNPEAGLDVIEAAINNGCNLVALTIQWDEVYKTKTGAPDWRQYDRQIEYIAKTNAKIALRIIVGRLNYRLEGFWTPKETMKDDLGRPFQGVYGRTCFSFSHQPTVTQSQNFIKEVCQRYNSYQNQGKILYVSFGNLPTQELGFPHDTQYENTSYLACFDYSDHSLAAFQAWAQKYYKSINKLNYYWGTKFTSFQTLFPPRTAYNPYPAFRQKSGKDWYLFLHSQLKNYIDQTIGGIKQINPNFKIVNEYGTVTDNFSAMLATFAFKDLDQNADGTKVHNDPYYNHRWVTDVLRSNSPNRWTLNEVFYSPKNPADVLTRQFDECFEHGNKVVTFVVSTPDEAAMRIVQKAANRWISTPWSAITPSLAMSYTLTEALDSSLINAEKRWLAKVGAFPQPVQVELNQDLLSDDYWAPLAVNLYPVVSNPVTDRASKPRKKFSYTLPKDVFTDPDGDIVSIEALEKPAWLSFEAGVFSGTVPDQLGDNKIILRATDNEGATVQTTFLLKVVNVNVKPIVKRPIPDFEAYLEQFIFYQFQGDHFDDPDGTIVRVQASGLRPWMTYTTKEFSAFPKEQGIFTVTLRAFDDDSAFVETAFKVKVLNRPPVVKQLLPEKIIAQNKAFRFKIPLTYFNDPDGEITRLKATNLPAWLTFDGAELKGIPPDLGIYRLGIRAFDNGGDSVETPFIIKVDLRGTINSPPLLRYKIPDIQLFVTQRFSYKIADSLFFDTNGYVDRIETPNLPSWLTFKNNEIAGLATQAGIYIITLRAVDDDETTTSTTFTVEVRTPNINFELIQAGKAGTRQLVGPLSDGAVLTSFNVPQRITIYANCDAPIKKIAFQLKGPFRKNITTERFPFALFDEETGFVPIAGSYTLEATAFNDSIQVSTATVRFKVATTQPLVDWQVYPNPLGEVCNLKLPEDAPINDLTFRITTTTGQASLIASDHVTIVEKVAYIDLASLQLPTGSYLLQVFQNGIVLKVVKILKRY